MSYFFQNKSSDDLILGRFEILVTRDGYMPYDRDCDEYLSDKNGNNCFDSYFDAYDLVNDAVITIQEHA